MHSSIDYMIAQFEGQGLNIQKLMPIPKNLQGFVHKGILYLFFVDHEAKEIILREVDQDDCEKYVLRLSNTPQIHEKIIESMSKGRYTVDDYVVISR